jgi:hypothetical protein
MTAAPYLLGRKGPGAAVVIGGGTGDSDGGFVEQPVVTVTASGNTTINGKVKAGSFGKIIVPLAAIAANRVYTFRYTPHFSQLAQQGKLAMVGFGLKNGNDFHIVGLRGDGSTGLHKYKVYGTPPNGWNKDTGHTTSDGGAAAAGTQAGPNYIRLTTSTDGATYLFETSSDGLTWQTEYSGAAPSPFSNISGVTTFGIALWFNNADAGPFSIDVDQFVDVINYTTLDAATQGASVTLSNGNLSVTQNGSARTGARSVHGKATGKYYFEGTVTTRGSISPNEHGIGIATEQIPYADICNFSAMAAVVYLDNASQSHFYIDGLWTGIDLGAPANGNRFDFAVDLDNGKMWIRRQGGNWNNDGAANPATNTNGQSLGDIAGLAVTPVWVTSRSGDDVTFNFGASAFAGSVPSGFTSGWPAEPDNANAAGYTTLLAASNQNVTLSNGDLTATHANTSAAFARSRHQKSTGKWYFEFVATDWNNGNDGCGLADALATASQLTALGTHCAIAYRGGNVYSNGASSGTSIGAVADGDRIDVAWDADNQKVYFRKNGGNWNNSGSANPATNTGGISTSSYIAMAPVCTFDGSGSQVTNANFGSSAFTGTPPSGFVGWAK